MTETILVTGATGNTGSVLLELLAKHDVEVRAMVRRADAVLAAPVSAVAVADLDDPAAVTGALQGVDRVYLVTPSSERAQEQQIRFAELAAAAGVRHIVKLSQFAADEAAPVRFLRYHAAVERRIRELDVEWTFLRPNLFLQGLFAMAPMIRSTGGFAAPIGAARVSAVDVRDIAEAAEAALTGSGHAGQVYPLTGPAAVTHAEIAASIGAAAGRAVRFDDVAPERFASMLRGLLPDWQLDGLVEDYAHYARGEAAEVFPTVTGRPARDLDAFVRDHVEVFMGRS